DAEAAERLTREHLGSIREAVLADGPEVFPETDTEAGTEADAQTGAEADVETGAETGVVR
ncbi:hypothetical protein, partial [Streptomyces sp. SID4917]|uniref:hypothetical protein n=1 Tax=Streptomyces sp. SID4917 TaxID=2690269 RepID=UPI00192877D5